MRRHSTSMLTARARRSTMSEVHVAEPVAASAADRKSTRLNSSHLVISYAVFCLKKKKKTIHIIHLRKSLNGTNHQPPSLLFTTPADTADFSSPTTTNDQLHVSSPDTRPVRTRTA